MGEQKLEESCLTLIDRTASAALQSDALRHVSKKTLERIVERDTLETDESCVYEACVAWAEQNCKKNGIQVGLLHSRLGFQILEVMALLRVQLQQQQQQQQHILTEFCRQRMKTKGRRWVTLFT